MSADKATHRGQESPGTVEKSDHRFRLFVESVQDYGIFMLDPDGTIASWNAGAERIKGYTEEEALGQHFSIFYSPEERDADRPGDELRVARAEGRYEEEGWRYRKDGGRFWASVTITAVRNDSGDLLGFGKVTRDLTERKMAEEELRRARTEAEAASQAKSDFLAAMSHELRTPLNAIIGYTDLIDGGVSGAVNPGQSDHLGRIRTASGHLLLQIEQILSLARIEAGREEIHVEPIDVAAVASEAIAMVAPLAEAKGLRTSVDVPPTPLEPRSDPDKLRQILANLLSNAVKFTDQGELGVRVREDDDGSVLFQVWDTGIGVAPADRERIFERFTQADQSSTRRQGGTGLGLSICRELARLLGGEVMLESSGDEGTLFTLRIPG